MFVPFICFGAVLLFRMIMSAFSINVNSNDCLFVFCHAQKGCLRGVYVQFTYSLRTVYAELKYVLFGVEG